MCEQNTCIVHLIYQKKKKDGSTTGGIEPPHDDSENSGNLLGSD
jgi:hypothetical protein